MTTSGNIFIGKLVFLYVRVCTLKNARNWKPCTAAAECSTVIDCTITKRTFSIRAYHRVQQNELQLLCSCTHNNYYCS